MLVVHLFKNSKFDFILRSFLIFQYSLLKEKIKSFVRPNSSSSTPATTISSPDIEIPTTITNTLSVPNASSSLLSSQAAATTAGSDIRAVKTMPELPSGNDFPSSNASTPMMQHSDQQQQQQAFIRSAIDTISSIYEQSSFDFFFRPK